MKSLIFFFGKGILQYKLPNIYRGTYIYACQETCYNKLYGKHSFKNVNQFAIWFLCHLNWY